jgi:hypothetical protein
VVTAEFVAPHHARIEPAGADHRIVDLGGATGILFGGQRVGSHNLRHGDVIRIGDPLTGGFVTLLYERQATTLTPAAAPNSRIPLIGGVTTIGREGCGLTLASPLVSRVHAEVGALPGGGHMLREGLSECLCEGRCERAPDDHEAWPTLSTRLVLGVATSIDALATGLSAQVMGMPGLSSSLIVGVVTVALAGPAVFSARWLGCRIGARAEIVGGLILLLIGVNVLGNGLAGLGS